MTQSFAKLRGRLRGPCLFAWLAASLAFALLPGAALAQGVLRDDFELPETILRSAGGDVRHQVTAHGRVEVGPHSGRRCEQLSINSASGTAIYYSYPIRPARVINELAAGLWIRSDRPGQQIAIRVVLPRSPHPETGQPLTTLLRGNSYQQAGAWQLLRVENLPRALEWQIRVLRSQFGPQVDGREAYVDLVLVNVFAGAGATNLWFDDLEITGVVEPDAVTAGIARQPTLAASAAEPENHGYLPATSDTVSSMPEIEYRARLTVGGQPFLPRVIEHRGESLEYLQSLGFNCVRLRQLPSAELLTEAARLKLWLICTPPTVEQLRSGSIGREYDPVLAWDLGSRLTEREFDVAHAWANAVTRADGRGRPIVCGPTSDLQNYTRPPFKIYLDEREVLGTTFNVEQYTRWLAERSQLARAGAPLWATIPTQASPALAEQMQLVAGVPVQPPNWQLAQMRAIMHAALASRARGLCFASYARLDAGDVVTRARATALELLNIELSLIERWPAAGNFAPLANTSNPNTTGAVLETDHSRLLLPIFQPARGQFVTGTQAVATIAYTVPGVPEGDDAYQLSPTALRILRPTRVAGGMAVVLDGDARDSLVVFTHDPLIIRTLRSSVAKVERRAAHLARELAALEHTHVNDVLARISPAASAKIPPDTRTTIESDLRLAESLSQTDLARSYNAARHALEILRQVQRVAWDGATSNVGELADPLMVSFGTLPARELFVQQLSAAERSPNRLAEGGCENLPAMLAAGWKHYQHPQTGIRTSVDLSPAAAHSGAAGLLLQAAPAVEGKQPGVVETPPLWITSAPVDVAAGDLLQIEAWVKIDSPIQASTDGLVIFDSHSGEPLAMRLSQTKGWRQLTLYRAARQAGPLVLTFALAGLGQAAIDDVTIQIVHRTRPGWQQAQR
jgi:hypothetical protein